MKSNKVLYELLGYPFSLSEKFQYKTKLKPHLKIQTGYDNIPKEWTERYIKSYPRLNEIVLPPPKLPHITLKNALYKRSSLRKGGNDSLTLKTISNLLYFSAGVKNENDPASQRFYPSAGARYPLELYLFPLSTDLPKNVFHYYIQNHSLEELHPFKKNSINKCFLYTPQQKWILTTKCYIIITAIFYRTNVKYGERGYRYILSEAGHVAQNFYLVSASLGLACCSVGGYYEKNIEKLLDVDGIRESVVYVLSIS